MRRLNLENSRYRSNLEAASSHDQSKEDDDEEEEWTKRYNVSTCQSKDRAESMAEFDDLINTHSLNSNEHTNTTTTAPSSNETPSEYDSSDLSCLQSIISTLRQTIHQLTTEKESLQQRLNEEQSRSREELQAFAKTLEGVDDLRNSAERMNRELRRIKVKGYKPTRSELIRSSDNGSSSTSASTFMNMELNAADEASKEMEEAIRLIECQNDALNQRWSASPSQEDIKVFSAVGYVPKRASISSSGGDSSTNNHLMKIEENDDVDDDGFMCYWRREDDEVSEKKKEKKAKEKRKKKKASSNGSVFTSFF